MDYCGGNDDGCGRNDCRLVAEKARMSITVEGGSTTARTMHFLIG